ncbi:MAG: hypothetical protein M3X11_06040, partial [Acidobacteriota bacterium]|nr:hypothetical protein [Acidobacteriota bacterium]
LKGTRALALSSLLSPLLMLFVAIAASAHGPDAEIFGAMAFALVCIWFGASGWGFINLLRGGFFKTFKERRIRAEAALLAQRGPQPRESFSLPVETDRISHRVEATSITEPTTRELRSAASNPGKTN